MDKLWKIVEEEGIWVHYCTLGGPEKINGLYLWNDGPIILLDRSLLSCPQLHRCVLAEEIGHYFTAPTTNLMLVHTSYQYELAMSQDERRALEWATSCLIPTDELVAALVLGCGAVHELAGYFNVTERFMRRKLDFFHEPMTRMNREIQEHGHNKT